VGQAEEPQQGTSGGAEADKIAAERKAVKEALREQYIHLMEMDELAREKLFILQVKYLNKIAKRRLKCLKKDEKSSRSL